MDLQILVDQIIQKLKTQKLLLLKIFQEIIFIMVSENMQWPAVMNGLALYGCLIPFGGTFLIFSDYLKPSMRLSALMKLRVIYIFSHDSIGLGEDGPTHQPIEQLEQLRAIPNLNVFRPADINETLECWEIALKSKNNPSAIALSRQKLSYVSEHSAGENMCSKGAYVLKKTSDNADVSLIASGSEVEIALEAQEKLKG